MNEQEKKIENEENDNQYSDQQLIPSQKRLYRSPYNFVLLGISGGIAEYMNIHPLLVRFIFILTAILGGWGIIAYIICAFLIPKHPTQKGNSNFQNVSSAKLLGFMLIGVGVYYWLPVIGIFRFIASIDLRSNIFLSFVLLLLGILILLKGKQSSRDENEKIERRFLRSVKQRRLLGICSGLANYLNVDVTLIRIICMLLTFFTLGLVLLFYLFIGYFIPREETEVLANE
ncbi:MAG: PspC domain-containing protein [Melioribacteraceae bacterium]|nr:PspC domain-containing protein [Melioribacteraceae bacterium]